MSEPPAADPQLVAYLHQHGNHYSRESLREQLLASGASAEQVDDAFATWEVERILIPPPAPRVWPRALGIAVLTFVVVAVPLGLAIQTSNQDLGQDLGLFGLSLFPVLLVGELIAGLILRDRSPRWGKALAYAPLFAIGLGVAGLLLAFGVCLAAMAGH